MKFTVISVRNATISRNNGAPGAYYTEWVEAGVEFSIRRDKQMDTTVFVSDEWIKKHPGDREGLLRFIADNLGYSTTLTIPDIIGTEYETN